jgi:hypothetical protein
MESFFDKEGTMNRFKDELSIISLESYRKILFHEGNTCSTLIFMKVIV